MSQLKIRGLSKSFGSVAVLKDIDLDVDDREFVVLVGPSGCGKSTLLRLMCGLEQITEGDLFIDGERMNDVPAAQRGLAMVFQSYALYPHMTVAQNMSVGLRIAKVKKDVIRQKVAAAADILQLTDFLDRLPKQLSGGQRQRVAIGRAIVRNPKIFLFDEPLSNLDAALRLQMRLELAKLHQELKSTIVYVTHDQVEAMTLADKIIVMNMGRIEQVGSPLELYRQPRNRFVAGFIGSPKMNFFEGEVTDVTDSGARVRLADDDAVLTAGSHGMKSGTSVTLGIRPEQITECGDGEDCENRLGVKVSVVERLGSNTYAYAQTEKGVPVTIELDGMSSVRPGDLLNISLRAADLHIFTEDGEALA